MTQRFSSASSQRLPKTIIVRTICTHYAAETAPHRVLLLKSTSKWKSKPTQTSRKRRLPNSPPILSTPNPETTGLTSPILLKTLKNSISRFAAPTTTSSRISLRSKKSHNNNIRSSPRLPFLLCCSIHLEPRKLLAPRAIRDRNPSPRIP